MNEFGRHARTGRQYFNRSALDVRVQLGYITKAGDGRL